MSNQADVLQSLWNQAAELVKSVGITPGHQCYGDMFRLALESLDTHGEGEGERHGDEVTSPPMTVEDVKRYASAKSMGAASQPALKPISGSVTIPLYSMNSNGMVIRLCSRCPGALESDRNSVCKTCEPDRQ